MKRARRIEILASRVARMRELGVSPAVVLRYLRFWDVSAVEVFRELSARAARIREAA